MAIFYFVILIFTLVGIRYRKEGFWSDYIGIDQCNAIKGIFILVVFMRHVVPYLTKAGYEMTGAFDKIYIVINHLIGQLLVVMFLFYSGYGIMESVKKKGSAYIVTMPRKRLLVTLLNFDVAVCCFALLDIVIGKEFTIQKFIISLTGWQSLGNSNWYIFDILLCYLLAYLLFKIRLNLQEWKGEFFLLFLFAVVICVLIPLKSDHWSNTIACFPVGMIYSLRKTFVDIFLQKRYWLKLSVLFALFLILMMAYSLKLFGVARVGVYNVISIIFAILVVMITMKYKIRNSVLIWLGINLFPLYIYQRIPMIALRNICGDEWLCAYPYIYIVACLMLTTMISFGYRFWQIKL